MELALKEDTEEENIPKVTDCDYIFEKFSSWFCMFENELLEVNLCFGKLLSLSKSTNFLPLLHSCARIDRPGS